MVDKIMSKFMQSNLDKDTNKYNTKISKPGEIWELSRVVRSPLDFLNGEQRNLYSQVAQNFLDGKSPPRYVMIVTELEPLVDPTEEWQEVSVMLLSGETNFLSDVDVLIPKEVSGMEQDLLAQTWHVLPMLFCNLYQPIGRRLSREIYDVLMSVGDYHHGLVDRVPSIKEIQSLGLQVAPVPKNQVFHNQEEAWSDVLRVPVAAYHTYIKGMKLTDALLDEVQLERKQSPICLSNWWQNIFDSGWMAFSDLNNQVPLAYGLRSGVPEDENQADSDEIEQLINQLCTDQNEQRLTAVKLIDLGMQVAGRSVALAVAIAQKSNQQVGVLLRVYPTLNEPFVPPNLKLILLDDSGQILREVTARRADVYIQLKFSGQQGEQFSVRVALEQASITEDFVI